MTKTNLECFRGDTTEWILIVTRGGAPYDLTGAKMWMSARRSLSGTQIFQRTSPTGITIDPDQVTNKGKCIIKLAKTSTSDLSSEVVTLYYDVQVLSAAGDLWTVAYGDLVVTPDATLDIV